MGGVDLMDALVALYRISLRSKKFYQKLIFHLLDVSVVNSWLLHRRDCDALSIPVKVRMDLQNFKHTIAQSLLRAGKTLPGRRNLGRPLRSIKTLHCLKKRHGNRTDPIPENDIRKDGMHHWQEYNEKQNRCKMPGCNKKNLHPLHEMQSIFVFYE